MNFVRDIIAVMNITLHGIQIPDTTLDVRPSEIDLGLPRLRSWKALQGSKISEREAMVLLGHHPDITSPYAVMLFKSPSPDLLAYVPAGVLAEFYEQGRRRLFDQYYLTRTPSLGVLQLPSDPADGGWGEIRLHPTNMIMRAVIPVANNDWSKIQYAVVTDEPLPELG
jgi:hypothetical protein